MARARGRIAYISRYRRLRRPRLVFGRTSRWLPRLSRRLACAHRIRKTEKLREPFGPHLQQHARAQVRRRFRPEPAQHENGDGHCRHGGPSLRKTCLTTSRITSEFLDFPFDQAGKWRITESFMLQPAISIMFPIFIFARRRSVSFVLLRFAGFLNRLRRPCRLSIFRDPHRHAPDGLPFLRLFGVR